MEEKIKLFREQLADSQKIAFFGGAGVSTASGIPDFRSATGLYMEDTHRKYSAEEIISNHFFVKHPKEFFEFYSEKLIYSEAEPNLAHNFLVNIEQEGKEVTVITQNIDGLHQTAGSTIVHELHGTVLDNYCLECHRVYSLDDLKIDEEGIPRCPLDQGVVRPDIVLYGENLKNETIESSIKAIEEADMLIVAGTSLIVYPAAGLINYFKGKYLVVVNKTRLHTYLPNALIFEAEMNEVFSQVR